MIVALSGGQIVDFKASWSMNAIILIVDDQAQYMKKTRLSIRQVYFVFKTDPNTYIPRRRSSRLQNGSARNRDLYQCRTQYYNKETHFFS